MRVFTRSLIVCALACLSTSLTHAQQTGVVSGHVTLDGKSSEGVEVVLLASSNERRRMQVARTKTDADGRFRLNVETEGRYQVVPFAPAYVLKNAQNADDEITVKPGQEISDVNFALVPGGVITGKVLTPDGRPAIAERIMLTPVVDRGQNVPALDLASAILETDDRGVYRLFGLPPGRYLVSAGAASEHVAAGLRGRRVSYLRTFHPDVTEEAKAKPIEVTAGSEVSGVDITMQRRAEDFTATGRVVDAQNQPLPNVPFGYAAMQGNGRLAGAPVRDLHADAEGKFLIENLTAGRYVLFAVSNGENSAYSEIVPFEVTNGDVSGLELKVEPGSSVSGMVVVEGSNDVSLLGKLANVSLNSIFYQAEMLFTHDASGINPDGSFRLDGLRPGKLQINLATQRLPRGFSVLRVERDGVALSEGIDIPSGGTNIAGVRVVLTYGNGIVRGQAKVNSSELPPGSRLLAFAQPTGANAAARVPSTSVDARGSFILEWLLAGEYEVRLGVFEPNRGVRYSTARQTVRVANNSTAEVTLVFESDKKPEN